MYEFWVDTVHPIKTDKPLSMLVEKKKKFESVLMRWMKLEPIIQSEIKSERKTPI